MPSARRRSTGLAAALLLSLVLFAVLAAGVAGCDDRATYSTEEVVAAFQRRGYTLVVRDAPAAAEGDVLAPGGGQRFVVIVASDAEADEAWEDYTSQQTNDSFDVRRANVVVISDSGLVQRQRQRVVAAMSSLPDHGTPVVIAG